MDNMAFNKIQPAVRKVKKKKQVKDELDRLKQAEKKKRRLEKALATSAAIRTELEKKKQQKKDEQQKLDEEGAAIAEAVALNVLLGEDSDDSCKYTGNVDIFMRRKGASFSHIDSTKCSLVSDAHGSGCVWGSFGNSDWSLLPGSFDKVLQLPCFQEVGWGSHGLSAGLIAAQAVSSLQIADSSQETLRW